MDIHSSEEEAPKFRFYSRLAWIGLLIGVICLGGVVLSSQPGAGGPIIILVFLVLLFIILLSLANFVVQVMLKILKRKNFTPLRLFYTSVILALGGIFLVGLQTLQQLQAVDIVLVIAFEILLNFYLLRRF